ncbi:MAG: hypothetical protein SH808_14210 [Saprospiraceae bacterium]|nr:hypothetical protein [Saprospiraceae bacterium]
MMIPTYSSIFENSVRPIETRGSWNERKGRLQEKFPILTTQDLILEDGNRDEMFENLLTKLGKTAPELHAIIIAL